MAVKVLVVEDDGLTRDLFVKVLSRVGGYDVEATEDPYEIIRLIREGKVNLVLMDVSLTQSWLEGDEMDGVALTRMLKTDPTTKDVPVLLISAFAEPCQAANMLEESGADDYIAKPITDFQALVGKIRGLLSKSTPSNTKPADS